tara:strand:+ start:250 stop:681 length:432 start_codon:yes stop_codon:yes gene_type:complete
MASNSISSILNQPPPATNRTAEIIDKVYTSLEVILKKLPIAHLKELVRENNNLHHIKLTQEKPDIIKDLMAHYKQDRILVKQHKAISERLKTVKKPGRPKMTEVEKETKGLAKKKKELDEHTQMMAYINETRPELNRPRNNYN